MVDIKHDLNIAVPVDAVFEGISQPATLAEWWTETSRGTPSVGGTYDLGFGPGYQWKAEVTIFEPNREFELTITEAMDDWVGTKVGFIVTGEEAGTRLEFRHTGWKEDSDHCRHSSFCWALYLRVLRGFLERGRRVPYGDRYGD